MILQRSIVAGMALLLATVTVPGHAAATSIEHDVDALFAKWNRPDTPGCAVEVIRDGKVVLRKGYGMADIERNVPIGPATVFQVGSMSKQFTAFGIELLADEGKLKLDDDIHAYLPELPDFGQRITLRNLLHHTSGLRDATNLLLLAGWRPDDVMTEDDVVDVLRRQHALNFKPGQEAVYSNTNFIVLGMIAQRVSGQGLPDFVERRIFAPLGMRHSLVRDAYGMLVPERALSYVAAPGGYRYMAASTSVVGAGGVNTTLDDLALWDANFYDARVGGRDLVARMQVPDVLNDGTPNKYAAGLMVETYRGAKVIEHSGGVAGYRAQLSRFPDQHFSVAILANTSDINPSVMARRIADLYLGAALAPKPAAAVVPEAPAPPQDIDLAALPGYYALGPDFGLTVTQQDGRLAMQATGQDRIALEPAGGRTFGDAALGLRLVFDPAGGDGRSARVVLRQHGQVIPAPRGVDPGAPGHGWKDFEGTFYSEELGVLYKVALADGRLMLAYPRGRLALQFNGDATFAAGFPVGDIVYQCPDAGGCTGFTVNSERIRGVRFDKVAIVRQGVPATTTASR